MLLGAIRAWAELKVWNSSEVFSLESVHFLEKNQTTSQSEDKEANLRKQVLLYTSLNTLASKVGYLEVMTSE